MKAYIVTAAGIDVVMWGETASKVRYRGYKSINKAGWDMPLTAVRVRRQPEFDRLADLGGCRAVPDVVRELTRRQREETISAAPVGGGS